MANDEIRNHQDKIRDIIYDKVTEPIEEQIKRTPLPENLTIRDIRNAFDKTVNPTDVISRLLQEAAIREQDFTTTNDEDESD